MAEPADFGFYFDPSRAHIDWGAPGTLVIVNPEWRRREPAEADACASALPALDRHIWVATSGSGASAPGRVRFVALSKDAFLASARAVNRHLAATAADVWAHALPVFHVGGLGILARAALSRARVEAAVWERWDAARFHARLGETGATLTALVPPQVHDLVAAGLRPPPSLRAAVIGGARLEPRLCVEARRLGWPCLPSYGLTETCSQVATAEAATALSEDCGAPLPVLAHAEIASGEDQRLRVRAASLLTCYGEMTPDGLRTWDPKRDGWFETDDLGRVTGAGVEIIGRSSDSVKVLGEMVSLARVEDALRPWAARETALGTADLAVVAVPHDRLGHEIVLVLSAPDRAALEPLTRSALWPSLEAFSRLALLAYERPRRIAWVDAIPRTPLGKCRRPLLLQEVGGETRPDG